MAIRLTIEAEKCTGCQLCAIYCGVRHRGAVDPSRANVAVLRNRAEHIRVPFTCFQCPDAACQAACPTEAIQRDTTTGALAVDGDLCIACEACVAACPYGNAQLFDGDAAASKCDLCGGRPECASVCPQQAITVAEGASTEEDITAAVEAARTALGEAPVRKEGAA